ncbi:MAG: ATP-binding protein [Azospirillaceae bacterium]
MRRLLPRTLAGQLVASLLLALVVAQAIGIALFADERRLALLAAGREEVFQRTAAAIRLLEETPPERQGVVLRAMSSPRLRFALLADSPIAADAMSPRETRIAARLAGELPGVAEVRLDAGALRSRLVAPFHRDRPSPPMAMPPALHDRLHDAHHGNGRRGFGEDESDDDDDRDDREDRDDRDDRDDRGGPPRPPPDSLILVAAIRLDGPGAGDAAGPGGPWLWLETATPAAPPGYAAAPVVGLGLAALAVMILTFLLVRRLTRPLARVGAAAEALGRGEAVAPLDATAGPIEIRRLTAAFNTMQDRLTRFVADRTRLLAAIGHDLRTPVTSLRLRAEMVEDAETRERMLATLEAMTGMIEATLAFAREEATPEATRRVDLRALVDSVVDDTAALGHDAVLAEGPPLVAACRPATLRRAVANLVENAVRYGGNARVALDFDGAPDGVTARVVVDDDGPGVPEDRRDGLFEPFVRGEASRSRETGGIGLGLTIARSVARAHGGEVVLDNRPGGGARAVLTLPLPRDGEGA